MTDPDIINCQTAHRQAIKELQALGDKNRRDLDSLINAIRVASTAYVDLLRAAANAAENHSDWMIDGCAGLNLMPYVNDMADIISDEIEGGMVFEMKEEWERIQSARQAREDARYGSYEDQHRLTAKELGVGRR